MSIHDLARLAKQPPLVPEPRRDLFGETEAEIRADEEVWDHQFAESRDALRLLAQAAAAEYRAGRTKPMEFTPEGRLAR
jgi:hypothetical protein